MRRISNCDRIVSWWVVYFHFYVRTIVPVLFQKLAVGINVFGCLHVVEIVILILCYVRFLGFAKVLNTTIINPQTRPTCAESDAN